MRKKADADLSVAYIPKVSSALPAYNPKFVLIMSFVSSVFG